jgi:nucleotidyltransferase/DNA polymerase involved in DNA repair
VHSLGKGAGERGERLVRCLLCIPADSLDQPGTPRLVTSRSVSTCNDRSVQPDRERKSSGSETTFPEDLTDPVQIEAGVIAMANVWAWCEKANSRGRTVTVKIKWADFQLSTRSRSMETASVPAAEGRSTRRGDPLELSSEAAELFFREV